MPVAHAPTIRLGDILNDLFAAIRLILDLCCRLLGIDEAWDSAGFAARHPKSCCLCVRTVAKFTPTTAAVVSKATTRMKNWRKAETLFQHRLGFLRDPSWAVWCGEAFVVLTAGKLMIVDHRCLPLAGHGRRFVTTSFHRGAGPNREGKRRKGTVDGRHTEHKKTRVHDEHENLEARNLLSRH